MDTRIRMEEMIKNKKDGPTIFELSYLIKINDHSSKNIINPKINETRAALECAFENGGYVHLDIYSEDGFFLERLDMTSIGKKYRLVYLRFYCDYKEQLYEWWEPGDSPFRDFVRFGDDNWDARTVCSDISVAQDIFEELLTSGDLISGLLQMRSDWNPKP
ncbi:DUF6911 family protein [Novispirillum itersonii]|uniref:DUF6911 family protein n=1 Tax=Novispirillum itersonii TaxID=189 RepID=UPI0012DF8374|nr:hypothetical protein [Novispirillum itersonii]